MATANLLPPARAVFYDANGNPLAGGIVHTYIPGGTTPTTTWQDTAEAIANTNPIILDTAGSCLLLSGGAVQLTVTDALGNAVPGYSGVSYPSGDLAAETAARIAGDAADATYLAPFTGAVSRAVTAKFADTVWVTDFGADRTGGTDCTVAINAAIAAVNTGSGGTVYFPAGKYTIANQITATLANTAAIQISGAGREVTELTWTVGGGGFAFTFVSGGNWTRQNGNLLTISDMTLSTGIANGGNAILVNGGVVTGEPVPASTFRNLTLRGTSPSGTAEWTVGINANGLGTASFWDISIFGADNRAQTAIGIKIAGSSTGVPTQFVFMGVSVTWADTAISVLDYVEGIMITGCNFQWVNVGVSFVAPAQTHNQCSVCNTQIQAFSYCITIENVVDNQIVGNTLYPGNSYAGVGIHNSGTGVGIQLTSAGRSQITGNSFAGASQTSDLGIVIANPLAIPLQYEASTIEANSFAGLNTAITIQTAVANTTIGNSNGYSSNVTTRLTDSGSNNVHQPSLFSTSVSVSLVGSVTSQYIAVTVPYNYFGVVPTTAFAMESGASTEEIIAWYAPAGSTPIVLSFLVARRDGATMTAGTFTFSILAVS